MDVLLTHVHVGYDGAVVNSLALSKKAIVLYFTVPLMVLSRFGTWKMEVSESGRNFASILMFELSGCYWGEIECITWLDCTSDWAT